MKLRIYTNFSKRYNSVRFPTSSDPYTELDFVYKDTNNILSPSITIEYSDNINLIGKYCYIIDDKKNITLGQYWIDNVITETNNTLTLTLSLDTLTTYSGAVAYADAYYLYAPYGDDRNKYINKDEEQNIYYDQRISPNTQGNTVDLLGGYKTIIAGSNSSDADSTGLLYRNVVNYVSSQPSTGYPTGVIALTDEGLTNLGKILMSENFSSSINKQLTQAKDAIISVKRSPVYLSLKSVKYPVLSNYVTSLITGYEITRVRRSTTVYKLDNLISDDYTINYAMTNYSPFVEYYLYLSGYGYIEVDANKIGYRNAIQCSSILDQFTGDVCIELYAGYTKEDVPAGSIVTSDLTNRIMIGRYLFNIYQDIPMGVNKSTKVGSLSNALVSVGSIAVGVAAVAGAPFTAGISAGAGAGMIAGGVSGVVNTAIGGTTNVGSQGGQGSLADLGYNINSGIYLGVYAIVHKPSISYDNLKKFRQNFGYPYFKYRKNNYASGYWQAGQVSINQQLPDVIKNDIINKMKEGFYMEVNNTIENQPTNILGG